MKKKHPAINIAHYLLSISSMALLSGCHTGRTNMTSTQEGHAPDRRPESVIDEIAKNHFDNDQNEILTHESAMVSDFHDYEEEYPQKDDTQYIYLTRSAAKIIDETVSKLIQWRGFQANFPTTIGYLFANGAPYPFTLEELGVTIDDIGAHLRDPRVKFAMHAVRASHDTGMALHDTNDYPNNSNKIKSKAIQSAEATKAAIEVISSLKPSDFCNKIATMVSAIAVIASINATLFEKACDAETDLVANRDYVNNAFNTVREVGSLWHRYCTYSSNPQTPMLLREIFESHNISVENVVDKIDKYVDLGLKYEWLNMVKSVAQSVIDRGQPQNGSLS